MWMNKLWMKQIVDEASMWININVDEAKRG